MEMQICQCLFTVESHDKRLSRRLSLLLTRCITFPIHSRLQDMRICLSQLQIVKSGEPLHDMADRLQKTIRLSQRGTLHFIPCTDEWSISLIRTKKRMSYVIEGKYIVTVSSVREHEIESRSRQQQRVDFQDFEEHYEVEVSCCFVLLM